MGKKKASPEPGAQGAPSLHRESLPNFKSKEQKKKKRKFQETEGKYVQSSSPAVSTGLLKKKKKKKKKTKREVEDEGGVKVDVQLKVVDMKCMESEDLIGDGSALASRDLLELKEFIPDVERRSADQIRKLLRYDLPRFRHLKREGVSIRKGRFTEEENLQIQQNVANFMALTGISSPGLLLFPNTFPDQEAHIRRLRAQHHFLEKIAEGIPRPSQQVCLRARKIFHPHNRQGRYSEEELHSLMKLQRLHGNNWSTMSRMMDRSAFSLEKRFSLIASGHGSWTADEESKLMQAIKDHLEVLVQKNPEGSGLSREQLCNNLPWKKICRQVGSRSWTQCRLKWFGLVRNKLARGRRVFNRGPEGLQAKIRLIQTLYDMQVDDMADVSWDEVAQVVGHVTSVCVQKMFMRLKLTKVPHWMNLSYGEIIDFLWENEVPRLKEMVKERQPDLQEPLEGQTYQLNDIICLEDREFMELDNTL